MYRKDRRRAAALYLGGGIALVVCIALIVFLVYALTLRTEYRAMCLEINDAVLAANVAERSIERGGESRALDESTLMYYDIFLLDRHTVVFNRKTAEPNSKSILIHLGENTLCFTGQEDGSAINIRWETPDSSRGYTVRSQTSFMQLSAYLSNYLRRES